MAAETIDQMSLERLAAAGAVRAAKIVGLSDGWSVVIEDGATGRLLMGKRGSVEGGGVGVAEAVRQACATSARAEGAAVAAS